MGAEEQKAVEEKNAAEEEKAETFTALEVNCSLYMMNKGCSWTQDWNCAGQTAGLKGQAHEDGTAGYECCCKQEMWKEITAGTFSKAEEGIDAPEEKAAVEEKSSAEEENVAQENEA